MPERKIVVAIGGSSGAIYAKLLMDHLATLPDLVVGVVMSSNAVTNWELEIGPWQQDAYPFDFYGKQDFYAPFASGSAQYDTMIVCPSSMGLLARITHGISNDLMTRAADVILKENRRLIIVPREAPYSLLHLRNMAALAEVGAIVCPATPSYYSAPKTVEEVAMTVVSRIIDLAGLDQKTYRWGE